MPLKCDICPRWYADEKNEYNKEQKDGGSCAKASKQMIGPFCKGTLRKVEDDRVSNH